MPARPVHPRFHLLALAAWCAVAPRALSGADQGPIPISATLLSLQLIEKFPLDRVVLPPAALLSESDGINSCLRLHFGFSTATPYSIRLVDRLSADARLTSGEVLRSNPVAAADPQDTQRYLRLMDTDDALGITDVNLAAPAKPAQGIASLQLRFRAMVADPATARTIHLKPTAGAKVVLQGLDAAAPADASTVTCESLHAVSFEHPLESSPRLYRIRVFGAAGGLLHSGNSSSSSDEKSCKETLNYSEPISEIDIEVFDAVRLGTVSLAFLDLPFGGVPDPAQLKRKGEWREQPVPPEMASPIQAVGDTVEAPAQASAPAAPAR